MSSPSSSPSYHPGTALILDEGTWTSTCEKEILGICLLEKQIMNNKS